MKVADILEIKGREVMTVRSSDTIRNLAQLLKTKNVGAMIVSADGSSVDGIVSERDIAYGFATHGIDLANQLVEHIMSKAVVTCSSNDTIANVANIMTQKRIRHIPVEEGKRLIGVISVGDVVKYRLDEMLLEANVLRDYAIAAR